MSSAANALDPSSRKTALEAVHKAGHSLPAASMSATTAMARSTSGQYRACWIFQRQACQLLSTVQLILCAILLCQIFTNAVLVMTLYCKLNPTFVPHNIFCMYFTVDAPICNYLHSAALLDDCAKFAAGKDPKPLAGTINKSSSRPGTAKARPGATIRPGASSAGLAATAVAASEGVCLQISNKKDERARKVKTKPCKIRISIQCHTKHTAHDTSCFQGEI